MKKTEKKVYIKIALLISIGLGLLYAECFYLPEIVKSKSLEIIENKKQLREFKKQNEQIENIKANYEEIQNNMEKVSEYIVEYEKIFNFRSEIENIAKKSNVNLDISISSNEKTFVNNNLSFVNYRLRASGDFNKIMSFLNFMENLRYYNEIEKIRISNEEKNENEYIVLELDLKVYVRDDNSKN
ncbi:MAG: type 4a pilus biogenesis protein PilO [Patescibacteria group bacterium]|nr:type 4a pilus biogenesis protein PilO [Patescibacteria group bacterium]